MSDATKKTKGKSESHYQDNSGRTEFKPMDHQTEWSVVKKVRLPHKIGMPLGSGNGGDAS